jgi:hypothetical protein
MIIMKAHQSAIFYVLWTGKCIFCYYKYLLLVLDLWWFFNSHILNYLWWNKVLFGKTGFNTWISDLFCLLIIIKNNVLIDFHFASSGAAYCDIFFVNSSCCVKKWTKRHKLKSYIVTVLHNVSTVFDVVLTKRLNSNSIIKSNRE